MLPKIKPIICLLFFVIPLYGYAQGGNVTGGKQYPQDYFRNPLDIPILLAGNFGECRAGHFHSGMDIKTQGKEGQPVHAAADGYISRIKMDKGGFGHALYITHPNGYTTLYAHLSDFAVPIQKYVRHVQYEKKRWDVDIPLSESRFPVKKGDLIALSGNTGGSTAPHLHFEIRDTKTEHPLNPQLFGLEVVDTIAPVPTAITVYGLSNSFYMSRHATVRVEKTAGTYRPQKLLQSTVDGSSLNGDTLLLPENMVGIGVNVNDYMDNSGNTITFYTAMISADDSLLARVTLDDIGYDETRYINAYTDYGMRQQEHEWVQCLFQLPGNRLGIYTDLNALKGRLNIADRKPHRIAIVITDDRGNESKIAFCVCQSKAVANNTEGDVGTPFYYGKENVFNQDGVSFSLDNRQLYDDINFTFDKTTGKEYSDRFKIGDTRIPLHHYFELKIRPSKTIPEKWINKVVMIYSDGKDEDGRAASPADSGFYSARVRNFGTYRLDIDTIPPVIESMQRRKSTLSGAKQIAFTVKDNMTAIKNFSGYLDGKWICFEQHGDDFFYKFDEHCTRGKHKLVFKADDENGNEAIYDLNFIR